MIKTSETFRAAIVGSPRRIEILAVVDISDPDTVFGEVSGSPFAPWSKKEELHDHNFDPPARYATLERDRWALDGSFDVFPDDFKVTAHMGTATEALSGEDGTFSPAVWTQLNFSGVDILQAASVFFSADPLDGYPVDFTVEVLQGGTAYFTKKFTGNKAKSVAVDGFSVYNPDAIRVTCTKWSRGSRRMRLVEILPGIYEEWSSGMLAEFSVKQQGNVACTALPYGTCTLKMDNLSRRFEPRSKAGLFQSIEDRQGIEIYIGVKTADGTIERCRLGTYYQYGDGWKTGDNNITMQWYLVDIIGLLADREFIPPATLPTTLGGWLSALTGQLGVNFKDCWHADPNFTALPVTVRTAEDIRGKKCGDLVRWVCMATGTWPRADASTGYLTAEPLWSEGNKVTLDNLTAYPTMSANESIAAIIFTLNDGSDTQYIVSGNSTSSSSTVSVQNPFIKTQAQALAAAKNILATYGGNVLDLTGRGDPSSEIGDVDTVWLDESQATTARRIMQTFAISSGVLQGCQSQLLQADGAFLFTGREVITTPGTWKAPAGKSKLYVICVGHGTNGTAGQPGTWDEAGADGEDGIGGLVWADTININEQQAFAVTIGQETTFGVYSSANGKRYTNGYTDVRSGESYGRSGVKNPIPGSGNGGIRGIGGVKGNRHQETRKKRRKAEDGSYYWVDVQVTVVDNYPGDPEPPSMGVRGCVVVYYDK